MKIISLEATPNKCNLEDPLKLYFSFESEKELSGRWELKWRLDVAHQRAEKFLLQSENFSYPPNQKHSVTLMLDAFPIADIPDYILCNVSVLELHFVDSLPENNSQDNLVMQVIRDKSMFIRTIFSSLE